MAEKAASAAANATSDKSGSDDTPTEAVTTDEDSHTAQSNTGNAGNAASSGTQDNSRSRRLPTEVLIQGVHQMINHSFAGWQNLTRRLEPKAGVPAQSEKEEGQNRAPDS